MKRWFYFVLAILLTAGIGYVIFRYFFSAGGTGLNASSENTNSEQKPANEAWKAVDRSPDGFKLEMPADPRQVQIPAYNAHGQIELVQMLQAAPTPETTFAVAWADDPPVEQAGSASAGRTLDLARDGALMRAQATLLEETHNQLAGNPTRDFSGRNANGGLLNARLILAGRRLYMLIATFPGPSVRNDADIHRFFGSFQLMTLPNSE